MIISPFHHNTTMAKKRANKDRPMNARELDTLQNSEAYAGRFNNDRRHIIYNKRRRCFELKYGMESIPLQGVTTYMKKTYWGKTNKKKCTDPTQLDMNLYRTPEEENALNHATTEFEKNLARSRAKNGRSGMMRGTRVDNEISKCMFYYGKYRVKPWVFIDRTQSLGLTKVVDRADKRAMLNLQKNIHTYTRSVLQGLKNLGLMPFQTQVRAGSAALRLGTATDIVCKRIGNRTLRESSPEAIAERQTKARGRQPVVIVELKCGYKNRYLKSSGTMQDECESLMNNPLNQHQLQLLATCKLFEMTYGSSYYIEDAFIIRVDALGVYIYRLQEHVQRLWPAIKNRLAAARIASLKAKSAAKKRKRTKKTTKTPKKKRKRAKTPTKKKKKKITDSDGDSFMNTG